MGDSSLSVKEVLLNISPILFIIAINIVLGKVRAKAARARAEEEKRQMKAPPVKSKEQAPVFKTRYQTPPMRKEPKPIQIVIPKKRLFLDYLANYDKYSPALEKLDREDIVGDDAESSFVRDAIIYSEIIGEPRALRDF